MKENFSEFIDKLRAKTDIVELIGQYVPLQRKGKNFWGCCPFHNEKTPSFAVNSVDQFYYCFGCKEGGNVFNFIQKLEHVEFMDAVRILCERQGMEMPTDFAMNGNRIDKNQRDRLLELCVELARHYRSNLSLPEAKPYNDYIQQRGIDPKIVAKFGLGASLDYNDAINYLRSKGYTNEEMVTAGVAGTNTNGYYDVYAKRLIFPIINAMGNVVAFGGRTLESNPTLAKYRNTSNTPIFEKSQVLYASNLLKKRSRVAPIDYVIITEGYMDVLALHQGGFDTAIASMGTALTEKQARQIKQYTKNVYISYDGDTAGQTATMRGLDILKEQDLTVKVISLPEGLDPDDIIKKQGRNAYQALINAAKPLTRFKLDVLQSRYNIADPDQRSAFAKAGVAVLRELDTIIEREQYLPVLCEMTGFPIEVLRAELGRNVAPITVPPVTVSRTETDTAINFVLACCLANKKLCDFSLDLYPYLPDEFSRIVYSVTKQNNGNPLELIKERVELTDEDIERAKRLSEYVFIEGDDIQKFKMCAYRIIHKSINRDIERLTNELNSAQGDARNQILIEIQNLNAKARDLKEKFNG